LDRTFGHGANCCFPQFFQKKKSKEQKKEKGKIKESIDVRMLSVG
jgi:hypothetical protein